MNQKNYPNNRVEIFSKNNKLGFTPTYKESGFEMLKDVKSGLVLFLVPPFLKVVIKVEKKNFI